MGEIPEGVAPCFRLTLEMARRFYVKDYKELKDARVVKLFGSHVVIGFAGEKRQ